MSYTAKTKCPSCGTVTSHRLLSYGFYGKDEYTICPTCGFRYTNANHCVERIQEEEEKNKKVSSKSASSRLANNELEDKLKWRRH